MSLIQLWEIKIQNYQKIWFQLWKNICIEKILKYWQLISFRLWNDEWVIYFFLFMLLCVFHNEHVLLLWIEKISIEKYSLFKIEQPYGILTSLCSCQHYSKFMSIRNHLHPDHPLNLKYLIFQNQKKIKRARKIGMGWIHAMTNPTQVITSIQRKYKDNKLKFTWNFPNLKNFNLK